MTPERWKRIEDVFGEAIELAETERVAFVARACGSDAELYSEVTSLLASMEGASASLQRAVGNAADRFSGDTTASLIGKRIGPYKLVDALGEGGMGVVYRGERDDAEYKSGVAIKILHHGLGSPQAIARFRDERQILAALEHPGIVRLLDGGRTDDGLPYLVMERVDGVPISKFARTLTVRDTIALVLEVCAALQYAHGKLVVHRDIKPSNILVDVEGHVKLLDFGIAKLIAPGAAQILEAQTRTGMALLTPEYASPEQARGEAVSVATDVYSLGAVIYELLANQPPQRPTGGPLEMLEAICKVDPPRPSTVAPDERRGEIAGDLDNILMKALHKEPALRYASIEQLADDLRRYLDGLPVTARTATFGYRAGKFARRNRGKLAIAALVATALSTATVVSIRQARRADAEAQRARHRFEDVRKLSNSLLFEIDESIRDVAGTTRARELIVTRALTYLDGLAKEASDDPALARELAVAYMKIGDIQGSPYDPNIGKTADGLRSYEKANALLGRLDGTDPEVASAKLSAAFGTAFMHHTNKDVGRARTSLVEAIQAANRRPAGVKIDPITVARAHNALAFIAREIKDDVAFERYIDDGLAYVTTWPAQQADARYWRAIFLQHRAYAATRAGDPHRAVTVLSEAAELQGALSTEFPHVGKYPRERAYTLMMLAIVASGVGDSRLWVASTNELDRAEAALREASTIIERQAVDDPGNADYKMMLAVFRTSLGLAVAKRSPRDALASLESALATFDTIPATMRDSPYGSENEFIAHCAIARSLAAHKRADDARSHAAKGLVLAGENPMFAASCKTLVAAMHADLGEPEQAAAMLADVVNTLRPLAEASDAEALIGLVDALDRLAALRPAQACDLLDEAATRWRKLPATSVYVKQRLSAFEAARCPR